MAVNPNVSISIGLSASAAGPLAFRPTVTESRQLIWFDRLGKQTSTVGDPDAAEISGVRLSPDGRTVALIRRVSGNYDVWLVETARGVSRRFTSDPAKDNNPTWSLDGSRIAFESSRKLGGLYDLYLKRRCPAVARRWARDFLYRAG